MKDSSILSSEVDQEMCFSSWVSYLETRHSLYVSWDNTRSIVGTEVYPGSFINTHTTIQAIGPGRTYKECDGIPRFSFFGTPTMFTTTTYVVTKTFYDKRRTANPKVGPWEQYDRPDVSPKCKLNSDSCDKLWGYDDERRDPVNGDRLVTGEDSLMVHLAGCYHSRVCHLNLGSEVLLFYWPPIVRSKNICAANGEFFRA
jgi:hypothetical protein